MEILEIIFLIFLGITFITGNFFNLKQNVKIKNNSMSNEKLIGVLQKEYGYVYLVKKNMKSKLWIREGLVAVTCLLIDTNGIYSIDLQYESGNLIFGFIPIAFAVWSGKKALKNVKLFIQNSNELQCENLEEFDLRREINKESIQFDNISIEQMKEIRDEFEIVDDNFIIITKMITNYYMELYTQYKNQFKDEISLLATVGVLDAQVYVFQEKSITIQEIINIAKISVTKNNPVLDFVLNFGIILSKIDNPLFTIDDIKNAWDSEKNRLELIIDEIMIKYPLGTKEVELVKYHSNLFMNSPQTKIIRQEIGIK